MAKNVFFVIALLCTVVQSVWAWDGSGTSTDPYLIKSSEDWKQLADDVSGGNSYSGTYFEMTADIDAEGVSVGKADKPFSGTFDGYSHTLTYDRGGAFPDHFEYVDDFCAPFVRLDGATIRHLKVTGGIFSQHMHAAGIASLIDGSRPSQPQARWSMAVRWTLRATPSVARSSASAMPRLSTSVPTCCRATATGTP